MDITVWVWISNLVRISNIPIYLIWISLKIFLYFCSILIHIFDRFKFSDPDKMSVPLNKDENIQFLAVLNNWSKLLVSGANLNQWGYLRSKIVLTTSRTYGSKKRKSNTLFFLTRATLFFDPKWVLKNGSSEHISNIKTNSKHK